MTYHGQINSIISPRPQRYTSVSPNVNRTVKDTQNILVHNIEVCFTLLLLCFSLASLNRNVLGVFSSCVLIAGYRIGYLVLHAWEFNNENDV